MRVVVWAVVLLLFVWWGCHAARSAPPTFDYDSAYNYVASGNGYTAVVFVGTPTLDVPGILCVDGRFVEGLQPGVYVLARGKQGVLGFPLPVSSTAAQISDFAAQLYPRVACKDGRCPLQR